MTEVVLNEDQARLVTSAVDGVVFRDSSGNVLVSVPSRRNEGEEQIIEEAQRRLASDQPRYTYAEMMDRVTAAGKK